MNSAYYHRYLVSNVLFSRTGWTKKKIQQRAKEQNPQLRYFYQYKLPEFRVYYLVFVDESGYNKKPNIGELTGHYSV